MTLTVCVGASGSGKTTFLEDVHKSHKCTYIRQYHKMRPYITVSQIPNFDRTALPYWDIYVKEKKDMTIKVGGTMAGEFTPGLSGGQRKLLLFELIYQRTQSQSNLLIVLDEPFSGVTDDFVPFIVERLNVMRENHNILLVTNDHIETLLEMADNSITVSAVDRQNVVINEDLKIDRSKAILALCIGDQYQPHSSKEDLQFFFNVELRSNSALLGVAVFIAVLFGLFLVSFWNSSVESSALILISGDIIAYFGVNPYLLSLVEWRYAMLEEAEALMHSSRAMTNALKCALTLTICFLVSILEFGIVNAVVDGLGSVKFMIAIAVDTFWSTFPLVGLGLYTSLPFQMVEVIASLPYLFMIFLSTSFSPGSGAPVLKEFRYLFPRFYFWCFVPGVEDRMEGCPEEPWNFILLVFTGVLGLILFLLAQLAMSIKNRLTTKKSEESKEHLKDEEFKRVQQILSGELKSS